MTDRLKNYLNNHPDERDTFLEHVDSGDLFSAFNSFWYNVTTLSPGDIFDLFLDVDCEEDVALISEWLYYCPGLNWSDSYRDVILFDCVMDVARYCKTNNIEWVRSLERIEKDAVETIPNGRYFRYSRFISDMTHKQSSFDEEHIVDAIRGYLEYQWKHLAHKIDNTISSENYSIKLVKIKISKDKKTKLWVAHVAYRVVPKIDTVPTLVNEHTGKEIVECDIDLPWNKMLTTKTLVSSDILKDSSIHYWVTKKKYESKIKEKESKERARTLLDTFKNTIEKTFYKNKFLMSVDVDYSTRLIIYSIDDVGVYRFDDERIFRIDYTKETEDEITDRFDSFVKNIKDTLLPFVEEVQRKDKNRKDREAYILSVIEEVKDEVKDLLPDIRSYYTKDVTVKFVSDGLVKSITYELDNEDGNIPFDKNTFNSETVIKDIISSTKPEKKRITGRSPLILHLNEKTK